MEESMLQRLITATKRLKEIDEELRSVAAQQAEVVEAQPAE